MLSPLDVWNVHESQLDSESEPSPFAVTTHGPRLKPSMARSRCTIVSCRHPLPSLMPFRRPRSDNLKQTQKRPLLEPGMTTLAALARPSRCLASPSPLIQWLRHA